MGRSGCDIVVAAEEVPVGTFDVGDDGEVVARRRVRRRLALRWGREGLVVLLLVLGRSKAWLPLESSGVGEASM
jgi:hypothetical protein